jgi:hypothetical protein
MVNKIILAIRLSEPMDVIILLLLKNSSMNTVKGVDLAVIKYTINNPISGPIKPRNSPSFRLSLFRTKVATIFQV